MLFIISVMLFALSLVCKVMELHWLAKHLVERSLKFDLIDSQRSQKEMFNQVWSSL